MKANINKSELMKRAWAYYRAERADKLIYAWKKAMTFGECLKWVWADMKKEVERRSRPSLSESHNASMSRAWYDNRPAFSKDRYYVGD